MSKLNSFCNHKLVAKMSIFLWPNILVAQHLVLTNYLVVKHVTFDHKRIVWLLMIVKSRTFGDQIVDFRWLNFGYRKARFLGDQNLVANKTFYNQAATNKFATNFVVAKNHFSCSSSLQLGNMKLESLLIMLHIRIFFQMKLI